MISLNPQELSVGDAYKILIGAIVPRPIAWVSTIGKTGQTNLAPFSFFNGICSNPPSLLFCVGNHSDGREKDTLRNIRATKEFVVNTVSENSAEAMNKTSVDYPPETSEFEAAHIASLPSKIVKPPRVADALIHFECKLIQIVNVGPKSKTPAGAGHVVIGEIVQMHFSEKVYKNGKIILEELKPIARLAGAFYCPVREPFELRRPTSQ